MRALTILIGCAFSLQLAAQTEASVDPVAQARALAYAQDFAGADQLLTIYTAGTADVETLRLHGLVLFWMKEFDRAAGVYERAIAAFPGAPEIRLDYGRLQFARKRWNLARSLLEDYLQVDPFHAEANVLLAWLDHWNGREQLAAQRVERVLANHPGDEGAMAILKEIKRLKAPYFRTRTGYADDDQPLNVVSLQFEAGGYTSRMLAPTLQVSLDEAMPDSKAFTALWLQGANRFHFGRTRTTLTLDAGLFNPDLRDDDWRLTGAIRFSQQIARYLALNLHLAQTPYRSTTTSLGKTIIQQSKGGALELAIPDRWMGKAAYERLDFTGANTVHQAYVWVLAPVIRIPALSVDGGYSFRFADATSNTFTPLLPQDFIDGPDERIRGFYDAIFTPSDQQVHALLASLNIEASKQISLLLKADVGVSARADNPYFYSSTASDGSYTVTKAFQRQTYWPYEWQVQVRLQLSRQVSLSGNYFYSKQFFFRRRQAGLELLYHFIK